MTGAAEAVVIGGSAGAFEALSVVLSSLPEGYKLPVIVVVHIPADKKSMLAELFQRICKIAVREAEDKEPIESATVYFAPPDYHLMVERTKLSPYPATNRFSIPVPRSTRFSKPQPTHMARA